MLYHILMDLINKICRLCKYCLVASRLNSEKNNANAAHWILTKRYFRTYSEIFMIFFINIKFFQVFFYVFITCYKVKWSQGWLLMNEQICSWIIKLFVKKCKYYVKRRCDKIPTIYMCSVLYWKKIQILTWNIETFSMEGGYITKKTARWQAKSASKQMVCPWRAAIYMRIDWRPQHVVIPTWLISLCLRPSDRIVLESILDVDSSLCAYL